jgi:hypothetical protein
VIIFCWCLSDPHLPQGLQRFFVAELVPITQGATGRRWPGIGSASAWQRLGEDMQFNRRFSTLKLFSNNYFGNSHEVGAREITPKTALRLVLSMARSGRRFRLSIRRGGIDASVVIAVLVTDPRHGISQAVLVAALGREIEKVVGADQNVEAAAVARIGVEDAARAAQYRACGSWRSRLKLNAGCPCP